MEGALAALMARHAGAGRLTWIGLRPARREPMRVVSGAEVSEDGLAGDRRAAPGKRAVTLIQAEHLPVIAALARLDEVAPELLRRNLVVEGANLTALRNHPVLIGGAVLKLTGPRAPCSRMEVALGPGGYNAIRGHGGWTAEVLTPGPIALGDEVRRAD